jgi:hypothetical protein
VRRMIIAVLAALAALAAVVGSAVAPVNAATAAPVGVAAWAGSGPGTLLRGLNGVSCVSAKFCAAVGTQGHGADLSQGDVPLIMMWNGKRWRQTAARLPAHVGQGELDSVSCTSAVYCVAVGTALDSNDPPLAETWNGRAWTPATLPAVDPESNGLAVSCAAARSCAAVGYYPAPGGPAAFLETLNGTKWTVRGAGAFGSYGGISCVSAAYCILGGTFFGPATPGQPDQSVIFSSWNGEAFTRMKTASSAAFVSAITGVSCVSAKACTAVGTTYGAAGQFDSQSFAVGSWNGRAWSVASVAGPKGLEDQLNGVSCVAAARCVAVGVASTNGSQQTSHALAVSDDGRSWTTVRVPALPKGGTSAFNDLSCVSAKWCVAVGEGGGPDGRLFSGAALTAFWNGKSWGLITAS